MIFVDRDQVDESGIPIQPNQSWFQRAAQATADAIQEGAGHQADKGIYADDEVKKALEKLFCDKCAYCESIIIATDWDVEHFRPKGRVAERQDHPGYFWLAYTWNNLYPSCAHCNQRRKDRPRWEEPEELPAGGKLDQFPLHDEATRAMAAGDDIDSEHTLLIDPCYDTPEWYLSYDPFGQVFALDDNPYGATTIKVFHLGRRRLRDLRRRKLNLVQLTLESIRRLQTQGNSQGVAEFEGFLQGLQTDNNEYAAIVRYFAQNRALLGF